MRYCFWKWSHIALDTKINQNDASVYTLKRSPKKKHLDLTISYKDGQTHEWKKQGISETIFIVFSWHSEIPPNSESKQLSNRQPTNIAFCALQKRYPWRESAPCASSRRRESVDPTAAQHSGLDLWWLVSHLRGTSPCGFSPKMSQVCSSESRLPFMTLTVSEYHHLRKPKMAISCFKRFQAQLWGLQVRGRTTRSQIIALQHFLQTLSKGSSGPLWEKHHSRTGKMSRWLCRA